MRFRSEVVDLLARRWHVLTLATLAGSLTVFLLLVLSLRAVGVPASEVDVIEVFAAWSLVRIIGAIPITPGGFGIVELGLTTALVAFGGANAGVVAAVLIYRFLTVVPTLVLGGLAALTWRSACHRSHGRLRARFQNEALCRRNALCTHAASSSVAPIALLSRLPASSHRTRPSRPADEPSF